MENTKMITVKRDGRICHVCLEGRLIDFIRDTAAPVGRWLDAARLSHTSDDAAAEAAGMGTASWRRWVLLSALGMSESEEQNANLQRIATPWRRYADALEESRTRGGR